MTTFKLSCILLSLLICSSCATAPRGGLSTLAPKERLVGFWSGADTAGKKGEMIFFAGGKAVFAIDDMRIGDPSTESPFDVTYSVNAGTNPWELDISAKKNGVDMGVLRGLLEVIDDRTIRVGFNTKSKKGFDDPRPAGFSSLDDESILILKRIK
jgi:hypothetical protein